MSDSNVPGRPGDPDGTEGAAAVPPSDPSVDAPDAQPTQAYPPASPEDVQTTQAYPPASPEDVQTTQAYPPASPGDAQPTEAYAPAASPVPAQTPYQGQPGYDASLPGSPAPQPYGASPGGPVAKDSRPRTLAIAAVIAAVAGLLLSLGGFIPIAGLATVLVLIGGLLLLAGFVLGLIVLINKAQGGKPLGITAVVVSVLGGILFTVAFFTSLVWLGLAAAGRQDTAPVDPGPTSSAVPSEEASEEATEEASEEPTAAPSESAAPEASGTYDEAAYLAAVRPEIVALVLEIQPDVTEEEVNQIYTDETLITLGTSFAALTSVEGGTELARAQFIEASAGALTEEQAGRFFDVVSNAAQQYLVQ